MAVARARALAHAVSKCSAAQWPCGTQGLGRNTASVRSRVQRYATSTENSRSSSGDDGGVGGNGGGREPVETVLQRILEPTHARSIGVSAEAPATTPPTRNDSVRALVPLNVIYLPPPSWHQPVRPIARRTAPPLAEATAEDMRAPLGAASSTNESPTGSAECRDQRRDETRGGGIIGQLVRRFWPLRPPAAPASTASDIQAATEAAISDTHPAPGDTVQQAQDGLARATAEKWQGSFVYRLLGAWRRTTSSVQAIPKDQDWVSWAGAVLNEVTGYQQIAQLKAQVEASGDQFRAARKQLHKVKAQHTQTIKDRIANQREISSLLQRKHLWSEDDVARFTDLYRSEHQSESAEQKSATELKEAESLVDRRYDELVSAIRQRYHEEQIWSDKIRRASTYGTWTVLCMNIIALLMAQAIFEPRKRRKIIAGVEEKLVEAVDGQQAGLASLGESLEARLARQEAIAAQMAQHLFGMAATLDSIATGQEAGLATAGSRLPGSGQAQLPSATAQPALLLGGDQGYSDVELDMYYAQQGRKDPEQKPAKQQDKTYTRAEAAQLVLEAVAVTGLVAGVLFRWLLSS